MKKYFTFCVCLFGVSACHAPSAPVVYSSKLRPIYPSFVIPTQITEQNYLQQREVFDSLPVGTPRRETFRQVMLDFLLNKSQWHLKHQQENQAFLAFLASATLFHPTEVYKGSIKQHQLDEAAQRLIAYYAPQGEVERVVLPLLIQMSLNPNRPKLKDKLKQIMNWVDETQQLALGWSAKGYKMIQIFEKTSKIWPSPLVLNTLVHLYKDRWVLLAKAVTGGTRYDIRQQLPLLLKSGMLQTSYKIAGMYLRVEQPAEALRQLQSLAEESKQNKELCHLLERIQSSGSDIDHHLRLAHYFEEADPDIALRICQTATTLFPRPIKGYECVGRIADAMNRTQLAIVHLEQAVLLSPNQLAFTQALAKQYQKRIFALIEDESLEGAKQYLKPIETFYKHAEERFKTHLKPSLGRVYYAMGHGFYNAGQVESAQAALTKAVNIDCMPDALMELGTIQLKFGNAIAANTYFSKAEQCPMSSSEEKVFWHARLSGLKGKSFEVENRTEDSIKAYRQSVAAWDEWQKLRINPEARAEAYIFQAQSLFAQGEKAKALAALEQAIDALPERKETYADSIALLTTYGHLPEALDALHRALGRTEVSEYLKTYCSMWVVGLAERAGVEPDALAINYLSGLEGPAWHVRLAQLVLGKITYEDLLKETNTIGQQAELFYYWANRLLAQGKLEEARILWQKVLDTHMMSFYEYDMAAFNLRHGAAKVATWQEERK